MTDLITADLVRLDADLGADKHDVIRALAGIVGDAGRADATPTSSSPTRSPARRPRRPGCPAASRSRTAAPPGVEVPTLAFARLSPAGRVRRQGRPGRPGLPDRRSRRRRRHPPQAAHQAGPGAGQAGVHRRAARRRRRRTRSSRSSSRRSSVDATPRGRPGRRCRPRRPPPPRPPRPAPRRSGRSLVAVTACPTGIAHTYMAAEALEAAAERAGVDIQVETQGSAGSTPLAPDDDRRAPPR